MEEMIHGCPRPDAELYSPIVNYWYLILHPEKIKKDPRYNKTIKSILQEMKKDYERTGISEITYTINPKTLEEEIEKRLQEERKLRGIFIRQEEKKIRSEYISKRNFCRALIAFFRGNGLNDDEFFETNIRGSRRYKVKVNEKTLSLLFRYV